MSAHIKGSILTIDGATTHLTPPEITILWAVMARADVTRDSLMEVMWPHPDDMPDYFETIINMRVHSLRQKLKPSGWGIKKKYLKPFELVWLD